MSVLKIKDQNNDWIQIPTIKGEKGDPFTYADFTPEQLESLKGKDGISPTVSVASDTSDDYRLSFTDGTHTVTTPNLIPEAEKILSAYPTDTASGSVASFPDGADGIPLKSCIVRVEPVQAGSGDPSPDNVRPITGWIGCEVQRTGKNLFDDTNISDVTTWESLGSQRYQKPLEFIKNGATYTVSGKEKEALNTAYLYLQKYVNGEWVGDRNLWQNTVNRMPYTFTAENVPYRIWAYNASTTISIIDWIQFEEGSTATDYEPYSGHTYPITFPTEAGTVYGGYVDVTGGGLVVDRAIDDMGNLTWSTQGSGGRCYSTSKRGTIKKGSSAGGYDNVFAEIYSASNASGMGTLQTNQMSVDSSGNIQLYDARFAGMTGAQIKAELQGVTMCYKLADPIHYPLTPTEIKTLLGTNNIWADTGDTEVEYRADTTLYIKRLTESDTDMIADTNIVSGQYFMVGNNLYRATANIASGASVIVGTNTVKVSLAQALNEIKEA